MLWGALMFTHAIILAQDFRLRQSLRGIERCGNKDGVHIEGTMVKARIAIAFLGCIATVVYFCMGFTIFILIYILCVATLFLLSVKVTFFGKVQTSPRARRLMVAAGCTYIGGVLLLWLPGEFLCRHLPIMERLPMHAIFHLTSSAGPHLLLTATALIKHQAEKPRSPSTILFMGLPAAQRRRSLKHV